MPHASNISIIGHAGGDPKQRQVGDKSVTEVSVAVGTRTKKDGQWTELTTWWRVSIWGAMGDWLMENCHKGSLVYAEGEASVREWTDKEGGKKFSAEVRASKCYCLEKRDGGVAAEGYQGAGMTGTAEMVPRVPRGEEAKAAPKVARPARPEDDEPPF